ncbi:MAG: nucleoside recognition domain-containing protein [Paenibacillaceae bacterium]
MRFLKLSFHNRIFTFLIGVAAIFTVISVLIYPSQALHASTQGLRIWWNIVFPSLLPFFILCDIVIAYGIAHALGVLIDPLLRRLFRLPGIAGWSLISGMLAGSPAGVETVVKLRQAGRIDQLAGERITMLSHFANPIFMITIVAVAFLQRPELALFICIVHYMSALGCAIMLRNYLLPKDFVVEENYNAHTQSIWTKLNLAIQEARQQEQRSFGQLLGEAVTGSLQKLMMIGGTIMIFSVLLELVSVTGISGLCVTIVQWIVPSHSSLINGVDSFISGITEVHIGIYSITQLEYVSIVWKTAALSGMISWGGLAVHMQVRALLHATDIRYTPFLLARIVQSILSVLLALLLWQPYHRWFASTLPSYQSNELHLPVSDITLFWDIYLPWRDSYVVFVLLTFLLAAVIYSSRPRSS